jgi:hypothetical protein
MAIAFTDQSQYWSQLKRDFEQASTRVILLDYDGMRRQQFPSCEIGFFSYCLHPFECTHM